MGHRFYEATMPKIADQLERLNGNLEALLAELRMHREARASNVARAGASSPRSDAT